MTDDGIDAAKTAAGLATAITRLRSRLRSESSPETMGWSFSQLSILARIATDGPVTARTVAQAEHMRPPSIAEVIPVLKSSGLVTTRPDPTDGRKILITATPKGRRLLGRVAESREAWLARAIEAALDVGEGQTLSAAIELIDRLADCQLSAREQR